MGLECFLHCKYVKAIIKLEKKMYSYSWMSVTHLYGEEGADS